MYLQGQFIRLYQNIRFTVLGLMMILIIKLNILTGETDTWFKEYEPCTSGKKLRFNF